MDITTCAGQKNISSPQGIDLVVCPLRESCKRFKAHKQSINVYQSRTYMLYSNGECDLYWCDIDIKLTYIHK